MFDLWRINYKIKHDFVLMFAEEFCLVDCVDFITASLLME